MSSGRSREYRKLYRPRNSWQPYTLNRPQYVQQKNRRVEEDEKLCPETRLIDSTSMVYNSHIDFELLSNSPINHKKYEGKAKVIILRADDRENTPLVSRLPLRNSEETSVESLSAPGLKVNGHCKAEQSRQPQEEDPEGPPVPKVTLCPENSIVLGWKKTFPVGAGMCNLGNTCYLNSTLQALFYTPAFCNWLVNEREHDENNGCEDYDDTGEKCIICAMASTLRIARAKSGNVIKPLLIYGRLRSICKHMTHGRQEDAHEFLRYLLEKMEQSYLARFKGKQLDNASKETTPLHRIFGGYMRTEICCLMCRGISTTFQHFQDLLLDIRKSSSLEDALRVFFSQESLEGDDSGGGSDGGDAYKCGKCQRKGHCNKRNYIQTPPKVLCIQLKRFAGLGGKMVKPISYPEKLDMSPFLYKKQQPCTLNSSPINRRHPPLMYHLTSVVSHCGTSMNSGHYTAVAKISTGAYFEFDDSMVHEVSMHTALGVSAYILMYEMVPSSEERLQSCTPLKSTSTVLSSTMESSTSSPGEKVRPFAMPPNRPKSMFSSSSRPVNGTPLPVMSSNQPTPTTAPNSTSLPPSKDKEKVYFGLKFLNQSTSNGYSSMSQPSRLNGAYTSRGLADQNGISLKKPSPESKYQTVNRNNLKVNGASASPSKISKSPQNSNSSWNSSVTKSSSPAVYPVSLIDCNRVSKSGNSSAVVRSIVSCNGTTPLSASSREVAEKSLNRLTKLGVVVGVSGKGRDVEGSNGKVDHLVPYPVLSGESSDEEDERRGKRSRKSSETGVSKPVAPSSEMTISGNLTADATAIAELRGWKVTGSTTPRNSREPQKSVEVQDVEVLRSRKDLPKDKVEVSVANVRERTGKEKCVDEEKKVVGGEVRRVNGDIGVQTVNGDHAEERQNGSSRPSSPCSSTSSQSSDSCSHAHIQPTALIWKILEGPGCNVPDESERNNSSESPPSKCKVLANGTGLVVGGEGGKLAKNPGASSVPVLGRSDARSLISNPS